MKIENSAVPPGDADAALSVLARLMPWLTAQRSMEEILRAINAALGSTLAWVVIRQDDAWQLVSSGAPGCTLQDVQIFLEQSQLQRHQRAWRVICWRRHVGDLLFPHHEIAARKLRSGILCKLNYKESGVEGYFFLAFSQSLHSLSIVKNVVIVLVEKLKNYLAEIVARERTAKEMQRIVT